MGRARQRQRQRDALPPMVCPVLIVGGAQDRHTSEAETRRMHAVAHAHKSLWIVAGAAHVDFHEHSRVLEQRVAAFLAAHIGPPTC
ncbi:alpha/beta hydrolase [Massilia sp. PAMC28688]|nr:alpha/beta hydrolase [Massilia sp. PAMC28688]